MKVAIHLTERVKYEWPQDYWIELVRKLSARGHDIYAFSDDLGVNVECVEKLHNFLRRPPEEVAAAIASCDAFVGVPHTRFYDLAKEVGLKIVGLKGATLDGPGVASPIICAGCVEKSGIESPDCIFGDELCMSEILPNDVMGALCA